MRKILLAVLLLAATHTFAQQSKFGNWLIYFGNGKISDKWSIWTEAQYRSYNIIDDREQLLLRTAAMYNITPDVSVAQGYAFVSGRVYNAGGKVTHTTEHRLYQQVLLKQKINRVSISHRYRIEERFLASRFRMRFRYFLSANVPINKKKMGKGAVYFSAYNEIFLHADKPVFDRNRLYGGLGYVFSNRFRMEAGAMTQIQENTSRGQFNLIAFHNFDL
ncbi:DUF2490 domain-containing protein [Ferruginibacter albus]|uniref:DUF2490 domain-containing protein n=1 Tax=Ferruginibacter albus TaxID=2875540 RepID=UPI001CC4A2AD|nr:DUF2490 domain-containing protein [Ferruginibacter albus]UAY51826.1 DUF2490 domain-containing protein [Ferruginibacter albus]